MRENLRVRLTLPFISGYTTKEETKKASATTFFVETMRILGRMPVSFGQSPCLSPVGRRFSVETFATEARYNL